MKPINIRIDFVNRSQDDKTENKLKAIIELDDNKDVDYSAIIGNEKYSIYMIADDVDFYVSSLKVKTGLNELTSTDIISATIYPNRPIDFYSGDAFWHVALVDQGSRFVFHITKYFN